MAFPTTVLPVTVGIAPGADLTDGSAGWVWTDITSSVRLEDQIHITQGAPDEASRVDPSVCRLRLDNRTGDFTPRNPLGAYYGSLGRNTPLRVSIRRADDDFARTASSGWGTEPLWGGTWTVTGGSGSDYSVSSGTGRQSLGTTNTWRRSLLDVGVTDARITVDVTNPVVPTGATISHGVLGRVTDTSNYYMVQLSISTAGAVTVALLRRVAGVDATLTVAASVGTHSAGDTWRLVFDYQGSVLRAKAWEPSGSEPAAWQVEATDTNLTTGSQVGLAAIRVTGNTNGTVVVTHDDFAVDVDRFTGFVSSWPPRWDKSGRDATVPIEANGILRRLGQGTSPLRSAPTRYIVGTSPVAYWTLEDGQLVSVGKPEVGASSMRPFVGTHPSGAVVTYPQWGRGELAPWLPPVLGRSGNAGLTILHADVLMPSFTDTWTVDFMYASGTDVAASTVDDIAAAIDINPSYLGGSLGWPQLSFLPSLQLVAVAMNGEPEVDSTVTGLFDGNAHHIRWTVSQSGSNVAWTAYVDGASVNSGTTSGAMTLSAITAIGLTSIAPGGERLAQGHAAIWTTPPTLADAAAAALGYPGESATDRLARLCTEEGIALNIPTVSAPFETPMGPQGAATLLDLLRECEEADQGVLYESGFGLGYVPREARYNRVVNLALDFDLGQIAEPPEPTDDDQNLRNRWTVRRRHGSLGETAEDADSIAAVGLYDEQIEVNHEDDSRLADHAAWLVHLGT